jgi:hypothetical protein
MRNMSFMLTTQQILDGTKTVTRRDGWAFLKPGDQVRAVRKSRGLRAGEKLTPLRVLEIALVTREPLSAITEEEVIREGFTDMTREEFIAMFCASHKGCTPESEITRIEFRYVD